MKKFCTVFILVSLIAQTIFAQNRNSIWCFGDSAGIDFRNIANPVPISSGMDGRGGCSSISDSSGNLLFYSYSFVSLALTKIMASNNTIMPNSNLITGWGLYNDNIIIPKPGSNHEYFNFYLGSGGHVDTTYYALIDMNLNGGLGDVVRKNVPINSYYPADCLTAVKHADGRDWWVIGKLGSNPFSNYNRFFVYLVTQDSVYSALVQDFGGAKDVGFQKIIWHPSNEKFIVLNTRGYMSEFNFDRCTGQMTLSRNIFSEQQSNFTRAFWEGAYSPNGNILYVSRTSYGGNFGSYNYLLQFDMTASDIAASCDTLDSTHYLPVDCGAVRRAPDGKIYYAQGYISATALSFPYADSMRNNINENLGVINFPDSLGSACDFRPFSFYLGGKRTYYGLPNNPDYDLGPVAGSICDSLTNGVGEVRQEMIQFFPNPATNEVSISSNFLFRGNQLRIFNSLGEIVKVENLPDNQNSIRISVEDLNQGIYMVEIINAKRILKVGKLLIIN